MKLLLVVCALFVVAQADWNCTFTFGDNVYDLSPGNTNNGDAWTTSVPSGDSFSNFYWNLCSATTTTPSVGTTNECATFDNTQVCQQDGISRDWSCGVNPDTVEAETAGEGVVMHSQDGSLCNSGPRESYVQVYCPTGTGFASGTTQFIKEDPTCVYYMVLYHDVGCPIGGNKPNSGGGGGGGGLSGGSVFLIIFFVGFAVYFAAGSGWNYYQGKRGVEIIPQVEFWKDLPFLCKDGVMFLVGKCTGGGSYNTVE